MLANWQLSASGLHLVPEKKSSPAIFLATTIDLPQLYFAQR